MKAEIEVKIPKGFTRLIKGTDIQPGDKIFYLPDADLEWRNPTRGDCLGCRAEYPDNKIVIRPV